MEIQIKKGDSKVLTYNVYNKAFRFDKFDPTSRHLVPGSLHWAEFDASTGSLVACGSDFSCKPTSEEMTIWQEQAIALAQRWRDRLDDLHKTQYIRFGDLPKDGRSTNYATGEKELGISAYAAKYDLETECIIFDDKAGVHSPDTLVFLIDFLIDDRTPYLVAGQECGVGSDGEPVLRKVSIIAELCYDAALNGFVPKAR